MGANSIRTSLTRESIISEIRLCRAADLQKQLTHIVVEGTDDVRFLQHNVSKQVNLYESFSGKSGVLEIVDFFNADDVIGVCDRDYDTDYPPKHIFYYDYSCLETMMLSSFDSFKKMYTTLYLDVKNVEQIYNEIFTQIRWLSAFRKINFQGKLGINFSCISIYKLFNKSKKVLNIQEMLSCLKLANREIFLSHPQIIRLASAEVKKISEIADDLLIANGHDVLQMVHCMCKISRGADYNENFIRMSLMLSYDFRSSSLFRTLMQYQGDYNLQILTLWT